jgi:DNA-binding NarL/FixJ family response regulator
LGNGVRVRIVDDHPVVRSGLVAWLGASPEAEVIGEVGSLGDALQQAQTTQPHGILLDATLPDSDGPAACRELRLAAPGSRILVLSSYGDPSTVLGCIRAGAAGYLLEDDSPEHLIRALRQVAAGQSVVDATLTGVVLKGVRGAGETRPSKLTEQEARVMRLLATG